MVVVVLVDASSTVHLDRLVVPIKCASFQPGSYLFGEVCFFSMRDRPFFSMSGPSYLLVPVLILALQDVTRAAGCLFSTVQG